MRPSGLKRMLHNPQTERAVLSRGAAASNEKTSCPPTESQNLTEPSWCAVATTRPSGLNATASAREPTSRNVVRSLKFEASQILTEPWLSTVARRSPSRLNWAASIKLPPASVVVRPLPVSASQRNKPRRLTVMRLRPFGLYSACETPWEMWDNENAGAFLSKSQTVAFRPAPATAA